MKGENAGGVWDEEGLEGKDNMQGVGAERERKSERKEGTEKGRKRGGVEGGREGRLACRRVG